MKRISLDIRDNDSVVNINVKCVNFSKSIMDILKAHLSKKFKVEVVNNEDYLTASNFGVVSVVTTEIEKVKKETENFLVTIGGKSNFTNNNNIQNLKY